MVFWNQTSNFFKGASMRKKAVKYLESIQNKFDLKEAEFHYINGKKIKRSQKNRFRFIKKMWSDLSYKEKEILKKALAA